MRALTRLLCLVGLPLGGLSLAASLEPRAVAPVEAAVLRVVEADGPPPLSCDEARALASKNETPLVKPEPTVKVASASSSEKPDYSQMTKVVVGSSKRELESLPGRDPDALPPQLLEGTAEAIDRVGRAVRKARLGGRARLTFFGASHVDGEYFTGRIRRVLQGRWGDLGHGMVLPAALYAGYRGQDINLCRSERWFSDWSGKRDGRGDGLLGIGGMSVSSGDPAQFGWLETTTTNDRGRSVSRFEVFTLGQQGGGTLRLNIDQAPVREVSTVAPTARLQRWRVEVPDGPHRLSLSPKGDGEVRIFGVSAERSGAGVIVDALGVRGRTARTWLSWDRQMATEGLLALNPDIVVLAYGTNEAADTHYSADEYRADLRAVLTELRRTLPDRACVLIGPSDRGVKLDSHTYAVWDRTAMIAGVQRETAPDYGCAFWDLQQATGGPGSMISWKNLTPALGAPDLIHFSAAGYERLADRFIAALDEAEAGLGG